jgi:hypothetical protein
MRRTPKQPDPWNTITLTHEGRTYEGRYRLESKNWLRVQYRGVSKETHLGSTPPDGLARLLLSELIREHPG